MKISCKKENLAKALAIVSRMVKTRATLPVLSNIYLSSDNGRLKLVTTDLEAAITTWVGAKIDEEGAVTLPARTLVEYVTSNTDDTISLEGASSDIIVKSQHYKATIKGILAEEFPIVTSVSSQKALKVSSSALKEAIFSVFPSAALDETRPVLSGVMFRVKSGKLKIVATDSYRLAEYSIDIKDSAEFEAIVPGRAIAELGRVLPQDLSEVEIACKDGQVQFTFGDIRFMSRQIEGAFPDYEQIIPKGFVYEFTVDKEHLLEGVRMANIFAREAGNNIKIKTGEGAVEISAMSSQVGDQTGSVNVSSKGGSLEVAFNAKYVMDGLTAVETEEVFFGFSGALEAALIKPVGKEGFLYVVMPLRNE